MAIGAAGASAIAAGVSALASIFGGIHAAKQARKARKRLRQQEAENLAWYERHYNEDATQRADAQRAIQQVNESIKRRNKQAAGVGAVMGGEEGQALAKEANNQVLADTVSRIAAGGEARKERVADQYMANRAGIDQAMIDVNNGQAGAIAAATKGVIDTGNNLMGNLWK